MDKSELDDLLARVAVIEKNLAILEETQGVIDEAPTVLEEGLDVLEKRISELEKRHQDHTILFAKHVVAQRQRAHKSPEPGVYKPLGHSRGAGPDRPGAFCDD